jgi:hypothetical protein
MNAISEKTASIKPIEPTVLLDLHESFHPVLHLTRDLDLSPKKGLIQQEASKISQELEHVINNLAIKPIQISKEKELSPDEKRILAQVRSITTDKIGQLLKGIPVEGVKLEGFKLLKQDGQVYDLESLVQVDPNSEKVKVRSKVTILPDGTVTVHQINEHPRPICEKVARQIAGTIDLALQKAYIKEFMIRPQDRKVKGIVQVGGERVDLREEMCG